MNEKIIESCQIISNEEIFPNYFKLKLEATKISKLAIPGQFVEIKCSLEREHIIRRPFGFHSIEKNANLISIIYEVRGSETLALSKRLSGEELSLIGPLGNGFPIQGKVPLLVAGGTGIAPLSCLATAFAEKKVDPYFFYGCNDHKAANYFAKKPPEGELNIATMDGSFCFHGNVVELLNSYLPTSKVKFDVVYTCGPQLMMQKTYEWAKENNLTCFASMERVMGCGFGVCLGCTLPILKDGKTSNSCVCKDGPVFNGEEIIWDE
ncbi:MAG: dihydroorotate dehydrogenase electron transfer subunit [Clostridia bacterium]